jgi:hypothetical protein
MALFIIGRKYALKKAILSEKGGPIPPDTHVVLQEIGLGGTLFKYYVEGEPDNTFCIQNVFVEDLIKEV